MAEESPPPPSSESGSEASPAEPPSPPMSPDASGLVAQLREMKLHLSPPPPPQPPVLESCDLAGIARAVRDGKCRNVVVMCGAGISVSAGIPDFRTPGSGLYSKLASYNLPYPEAIFSIDYFREHPEPFFKLAKELYPGEFAPTKAHFLLRVLHEHGLLLRAFTQNIDTLESVAGLPLDKIVFAHGSFSTAHCTVCQAEHTMEYVRERIFRDELPRCRLCDGVVKPDIVFYGESLPQRFFVRAQEDIPNCDLLIVMGTSLQVMPFASLADRVGPGVPRLLINREKVHVRSNIAVDPQAAALMQLLGISHRANDGFEFDQPENKRDVLFLGACDDGAQALADALGFGEELQHLASSFHASAQPTQS